MSLPRRAYEKSFVQDLVDGLTEELKTPEGTQKLKPTQAVGLYELNIYRGLFGAQRVGSGKTLETLLAPTVLEDHRSVLLLPAALIAKTERERSEVYSPHWKVSRGLRPMSYEQLGRTQAVDEKTGKSILDTWRPTLIIADECHKLKNAKAAVTRRVARYMADYPDTVFAALSGTIVKHSLSDYGHMLAWCLKNGAPVPLDRAELLAWGEVLDAGDDWSMFADAKKRAMLEPLRAGKSISVREAFQQRLSQTPGVVMSEGDRGCTASLLIRGIEFDVSPKTEQNFEKLRQDWETPDGWMMSDGMECWKTARELACGLHYLWDPRPPEEWLEARRAWAKFARDTLLYSRTYDSEMQLAAAVDRGVVKDGGVLDAWRKMKPTFVPNVVYEWHDDAALDVCMIWAKHEGPGIIWTAHEFFARELAKQSGFMYYGAGGMTDDGGTIEQEGGKKTVIASMPANGTGRNLQAFSRSLVTAAPSGGDQWEQLLGRTHREGQKADEIVYDVLLGCRESVKSIQDAMTGARMIQETTGLDQLLLSCDMDVGFEDDSRVGWRWQKQRGVK